MKQLFFFIFISITLSGCSTFSKRTIDVSGKNLFYSDLDKALLKTVTEERDKNAAAKTIQKYYCGGNKQIRKLSKRIVFVVPKPTGGIPIDKANEMRDEWIELAENELKLFYIRFGDPIHICNKPYYGLPILYTIPTNTAVEHVAYVKNYRFNGNETNEDEYRYYIYNADISFESEKNIWIQNKDGKDEIYLTIPFDDIYHGKESQFRLDKNHYYDKGGSEFSCKMDTKFWNIYFVNQDSNTRVLKESYYNAKTNKIYSDTPSGGLIGGLTQTLTLTKSSKPYNVARLTASADLAYLINNYTFLLPDNGEIYKYVSFDSLPEYKLQHLEHKTGSTISAAVEDRDALWKGYLKKFTSIKKAITDDPQIINYEVSLDLNEFCAYGRPVSDLVSK